MTALPAEKLEMQDCMTFSCLTCWDSPTCGLTPKGSGTMEGCKLWRCPVCRGPWWATSMNHNECLRTGVPNGVFYRDGSHMTPLNDANGHAMDGPYCRVHHSCLCGLSMNRKGF